MYTRWFNIIKKTGLSAEAGDGDNRRIIVVNLFSFCTAVLCTFCGVSMAAMSGDWTILYTALCFVCGFLSVLYFNKKHQHSVAKCILMLVYCCVMLYYGAIFGESTQVLFLGMFLIGVPLLICNAQEKVLRFSCLVAVIACMVMLEANYFFSLVKPMELDRLETFIFRWIITCVVVTLNIIVISIYQIHLNGFMLLLRRRADLLTIKNSRVESQEQELKAAYMVLESNNEKLEILVRERTRELQQVQTTMDEVLRESGYLNMALESKEASLENTLASIEVIRGEMDMAKNEAQKANNAKTAYLREISHEIRNPLNAITGISYLLLNDPSFHHKVPRSLISYIRNISSSSQNLLEIINNVLELARIEAGKTEAISRQYFPIREWLREVVDVYTQTARAKDVQLQLVTAPDLPEEILGDRVHINQVLNNLITNALKFTPAGKNITVHCFLKEKDYWCISVADEGVGIPEEKQHIIFQPFEQANLDVQKHYGGTGLGLTISRRLTELMKGTIEVWSKPGEGTVFTLKLPLEVAPAVASPAREEKKEFQPFLPGKVVLLMEDSVPQQQIMERFFSQLDITLHLAADGEEGMQKVHELHPDLIVMDMNMPKLTGREVIRLLRQDPELMHIPVIAISADAFREQQLEALAAGVNEYLIKPVEFSALYNSMDKFFHAQTAYTLELFKAS